MVPQSYNLSSGAIISVACKVSGELRCFHEPWQVPVLTGLCPPVTVILLPPWTLTWFGQFGASLMLAEGMLCGPLRGERDLWG